MPTPVAVVTGAARGIGAAIVTELASQGWSVAVADLEASAAEKTASGLPLVDGAVGIGIGMDVADTASTQAAIERVETELGAIDALVNNAGIDVIKPFVDSTEEEWDRWGEPPTPGTSRPRWPSSSARAPPTSPARRCPSAVASR